MSKYLLIGILLLSSVACGASAAPTLAPTAAPLPTVALTPEPTAATTPPPEPTAAPLPTATLTPEPTAAAPTIEAEHEPPSEEVERATSVLDAVFPEISEKMRDIRPVYTAYFHSADWQAPGKDTTVDEVFKLLKMDNIATHDGYQEILPAMVVDHEPDLIIADSIESVIENPGLSGLHMVSDIAHIPHHIFVMKEGYSFYVADPGFRDTVKAFAAFAYPDTFSYEEEPGDDHSEGHAEAGHEEGSHDGDHEGDHEAEGHEEGGHGHGDGHGHSHSHSN